VHCDGYEDYSSGTVLIEHKKTALLPSTAAVLSIYQPSSTLGIETQEEYQYFLHYRNQTVINLSGAMPEDVWSDVIPRANVGHIALRNLTLAVSAMDKAKQSSSPVLHSQFAVRTILSFRAVSAALSTMLLSQSESSPQD
jgi:hypothetical protein